MKRVAAKIGTKLSTLYDKSTNQLEDLFLKQRHKITITGLSRSGKSMLFTSLMTTLKYRSEHQYQCLPLLQKLPMELVEKMWIEEVDDHTAFPYELHLDALNQGKWPSPTEQIYAFRLVIRLKQTHSIKRHLLPFTDIVFEFLDYPGEWITDLPMLNTPYERWSDSCWAQQITAPQNEYAAGWHSTVEQFDFSLHPTEETVSFLVNAYRQYLAAAKKGGISMLQPGSFLIEGQGFNWKETGFTPLPAKIAHDNSHPWTQLFKNNYSTFQDSWLRPLQASAFQQADKQIILVDILEGLNHSKQHLLQLKETLTHLSHSFVYGNTNWFEKKVLNKNKIGRVAFVATKMDLIPAGHKSDLLLLLKDLTTGARARFSKENIEFEHFLVSAIHATDEGSSDEKLRYVNQNNQYIEAAFEPIPQSISDMSQQDHYPTITPSVPNDYLPRILNGRGLDRLFQFLLES